MWCASPISCAGDDDDGDRGHDDSGVEDDGSEFNAEDPDEEMQAPQDLQAHDLLPRHYDSDADACGTQRVCFSWLMYI